MGTFLLFLTLTCPKNGELSSSSMELTTAGLYYSFPLCRNFGNYFQISFYERRIIRGAEFSDDVR